MAILTYTLVMRCFIDARAHVSCVCVVALLLLLVLRPRLAAPSHSCCAPPPASPWRVPPAAGCLQRRCARCFLQPARLTSPAVRTTMKLGRTLIKLSPSSRLTTSTRASRPSSTRWCVFKACARVCAPLLRRPCGAPATLHHGAPHVFHADAAFAPCARLSCTHLGALLRAAAYAASSCDREHALHVLSTDARLAHRCGHCKSLAPEYAAAATALKASKPDVLLAKVDATVETALATRFDVQGFPTLKWFVDGELAGDYTGGRTSAELVQWVTKKTSDPLKALASAADADTFRSEAGLYAVVALVADAGGEEATALRQVAVALDETFGLTTEASVAKHMGMADAKAPALAIVKSFDEPLVIMEEAFTADAITAFVKKYSRPLTIPFSQANAPMIFKSTHQVLTIAPAEGIEGVSTALRAAALALRGSGLQFVTVDPADADVGQVLTFFGVDAGITAPVVKGFSTADGKVNKFNMPAGNITATSLEAFARTLLDGTAAPTYNSAPAPEVNDGPVTIVTGNTFDQIVLDTTKDVLLEVYAPWCGHWYVSDVVLERTCNESRPVLPTLTHASDPAASSWSRSMKSWASVLRLLTASSSPRWTAR